jgi:hypothetical protein
VDERVYGPNKKTWQDIKIAISTGVQANRSHCLEETLGWLRLDQQVLVLPALE